MTNKKDEIASDLVKMAKKMVAASKGTFQIKRIILTFKKNNGSEADFDEFLDVFQKLVKKHYGEKANLYNREDSVYPNRGRSLFKGDVVIKSPKIVPMAPLPGMPREQWDAYLAFLKDLRKAGYREKI
jgi:hypothetical protein